MVTTRYDSVKSSRWPRRSVEVMVSSVRWMPTSRSTIRASSEASMPSRAYLDTPAERTRMRPLAPRSASMCSRSAWAITLRQVLA